MPSAAAITYNGRFPVNGFDEALNFNDTLTWTRGAHTFKFGLSYERDRNNEGREGSFSGTFDFGRDAVNPLDTNYAYSNLALGVFRSYTDPLRAR